MDLPVPVFAAFTTRTTDYGRAYQMELDCLRLRFGVRCLIVPGTTSARRDEVMRRELVRQFWRRLGAA